MNEWCMNLQTENKNAERDDKADLSLQVEAAQVYGGHLL